MSEYESSSKDERMDYDLGCDRLSELPTSIMDIILSSISTRDAVRMSILAKQYRYAWISLPHLGFDLSEFSSTGCMEKFVTNVLKLHKGPILKFVISAFPSSSIVDKWLLFLPENEIRELILEMELGYSYYPNWHQVRSTAYSFNKLTHLELHNCNLGPPPLNFRGFLFLRCLILVDVYVYFNDVEMIVAGSPLLATLKLDGCVSHGQYPGLKISSPNLEYLDLEISQVDCMQVYLCAPLLVEISISIKFDYVYHEIKYMREDCSTYNYSNFFGGCTSLQKLKGNYFTKIMSYGIDSCQYSFVLPYLKVIELDDVNFNDVKETSIVARLVAGAPNLKELVLSSMYDKEEEAGSASDVPDMEFIFPPNFKCQDLRIITMWNITISPSQMEFLKLLLENSPALERLNIRPYGFSFQEDECLRAEVLKFNIASPNLTLWFG